MMVNFRGHEYTMQQMARFTEERLHPVVHALLREVFGDALPPEPPRSQISVVDVWGSAAR